MNSHDSVSYFNEFSIKYKKMYVIKCPKGFCLCRGKDPYTSTVGFFYFIFIFFKKRKPGMVAHPCNLSTEAAVAGGLNSKPAWSTQPEPERERKRKQRQCWGAGSRLLASSCWIAVLLSASKLPPSNQLPISLQRLQAAGERTMHWSREPQKNTSNCSLTLPLHFHGE